MVQLEFGEYAHMKVTKEKHFIQIIAKAKYLDPPLTEADIIKKTCTSFWERAQIAVIRQGLLLKEFMVLLIKWENIDSPNNMEINKNKTYQNRNTFTYKNKNDFKKECRPNTQTFNKTGVATITSNNI